MSTKHTSGNMDAFGRFLLALVRERRGSGGWVRAEVLAEEANCSRATAYRYLNRAESIGFAMQRHTDWGGRRAKYNLGVRSLLIVSQRELDLTPERWATLDTGPGIKQVRAALRRAHD